MVSEGIPTLLSGPMCNLHGLAIQSERDRSVRGDRPQTKRQKDGKYNDATNTQQHKRIHKAS